MSETKPYHFEVVLLLTAFAAGAVDVTSFAKLGGIFASAMTGNLALFALYIASFRLFSAIGTLIALAGFITGVSLGTLLTRDRLNQKAITILLGVETSLLLAAAALWFVAPHRSGCLPADFLILILAIAMGLQGVIGKKINLSSIPTIVFTSTLTNIVTSVTHSLARGEFSLSSDTKRQMTSFGLYFAGAFTAGLLSFCNLGMVILLPLAAIAAAFAIHLQNAVVSDPVAR
jgi:uncharacterized membrane protein YoaK (UPF0700 family)